MLASITWAFLPTLHGRSPASVVVGTQRLATLLRSVEASDVTGFIRGTSPRETIGAWEFPTLSGWSRSSLDSAEQSWAEKVANDLAAKLGSLAPGNWEGYKATKADPRVGLASGRGFKGRIDSASDAFGERSAKDSAAGLARIKPRDVEGFLRGRPDRAKLQAAFPAHASIVTAAEEAWVIGSVEALEAEVEPLLASDPARASKPVVRAMADLASLGATTGVLARVTRLRSRAVATGLERAKLESLALVKDRKYAAAAAAAGRFRTSWAGEAVAVGRRDEVERFAEGYAFLADLARLARRPDPK